MIQARGLISPMLCAAALALSGLAMASPASASRVSPMLLELAPQGGKSIGRVQFTNTADAQFPVETMMFEGEISEIGELTLKPADEDFLVFPAQMIVPPKGDQVFRVQYVGEPELDRSKIYYLSIKQVPVDLETGDPKVQMVVRYNILVNMEPRGMRAEPRVMSVSKSEKDGVKGYEVRVRNDGNGIMRAGQTAWTFSAGEKTFELDGPTMLSTIGVGVVAPEKERLFFVPVDWDDAGEDVSITFDM